MTAIRSLSAAVLLGFWIVSGITQTASAQADLPAIVTDEVVEVGDESTRPAGFLNCFAFRSDEVGQYTVHVEGEFSPAINVWAGQECGRSAIASHRPLFFGVSKSASLNFRYGGGVVFIHVSEGAGMGRAKWPYRVAVTERGRPAPFAAAAAMSQAADPVSSGSASTVSEIDEARATGLVFADCPSCPSMVVIPPGSFMMGSPASEAGRGGSEGPRHPVTLSQPFALGRYEVTFDEYDACVAAGGCLQKSDNDWGRGRRPAIRLTYSDAQRYVAWLSRSTGQRYFIPSEAEWEYAARAGTSTPWNTGTAVIADDANILNQFGKTVVVGGYAPNAFGLHDTIGNVAEWTQDCIDTGYVGAPTDGSVAAGGDCSTQAVTRGGHFGSTPTATRSAHRQPTSRTQASPDTGLRVARAL